MMVLGIESSCDETAAALVEDGNLILGNAIASQLDRHGPFGGVVPEIAGRAHVEKITIVIEEALGGRGLGAVDAVAVVNGPGLAGSLIVGLSAAKALAFAIDAPLAVVDHLDAHVYACAMSGECRHPFVALVASGGHTCLYLAESPMELALLGSTIDDAAGEAFDKVSALLGLGYPGGPAIELAARGAEPGSIDFPRARLGVGGGGGALDYRCAGLKTAVLYHLRGGDPKGETRLPGGPELADVAASFQEAVVDALVEHLLAGARECGVGRVTVGGGVGANSRLREKLAAAAGDKGMECHLPPKSMCTDNAAMVAGLGYHRLKAGLTADLDLDAEPGLLRPGRRIGCR